MGETYSMHIKMENAYKILIVKSEKKCDHLV